MCAREDRLCRSSNRQGWGLVGPFAQAKKALVQAAFGRKAPVRVAALRALAKRGDATLINDIEPAMHADKAVVSYTAAAAILHLLAPGRRRSTDFREWPPISVAWRKER